MKINVLDLNLGIQKFLEPTQETSLPQPRTLVSSAIKDDGLEELYAPKNYKQLIEEVLFPQISDSEILRPEIFSQNLLSCIEKMKYVDNDIIKQVVNEDLQILLENQELLRVYCGLMIEG